MNKKTRKLIGVIFIVVAMIWWMQDYRNTMKQTQPYLMADTVESYTYEAKTQKSSTAFAIYKYKKQFIFVVRYTDNDAFRLETKALNATQQEKFIKEINEKAAKEVKQSDDSKEKSGVTTNGEYHKIAAIDMKKIGIPVTAAQDVVISKGDAIEEEASKDVKNQEAMELIGKDKKMPLKLSSAELEELIQQQFEKKVNSRLKKIRLKQQKEEEVFIEAVGFDGKSYQAVCSLEGYVSEIKETEKNG